MKRSSINFIEDHFYLGFLEKYVAFFTTVVFLCRCETPAGAAGQVRREQALKRRGGSPHAPRKASACRENQRTILKL
jgi:hypothetical protein